MLKDFFYRIGDLSTNTITRNEGDCVYTAVFCRQLERNTNLIIRWHTCKSATYALSDLWEPS